MLAFFRKYQKAVFGVVAATLVASVSFVGGNSFFNKEAKEKDFILGSSINGSNMMHQDIEHLVRLIETDRLDSEAMMKGVMPNIFNDGVIRKDFVETGLATLLVEHYFDNLKGDLEERLQKQKRFKFYSHPEAPFISAENIYAQFMPNLLDNIQEIKKDSFSLTKENFSKVSDLYLEQSRLPSYLLRRFLGYQEQQYQIVRQDPYLQQGDLSLFYFHTAEDWFGPTFLRLIAQVIHNGAIYAKDEGYKVSLEEARADLFKKGYEALKAQKKDGEVNAEELAQAWKIQLNTLRMSEKKALQAWQSVMLFRKLFEDFGDKTLVDRLVYDQYHAFASQGVEVDLYQLPVAAKPKDLRTLFKLQAYLEAVSSDRDVSKKLTPILNVKSTEEIKKTAPSLLEKTFEIEMAQVKKQEATASISLKDTWKWEVEDNNWNQLKVKFSDLANDKIATKEARLIRLDALEDEKRYQIDEYARGEILKNQTDVMDTMLSQEPLKATKLKVLLGGHKEVLPGIIHIDEFVAVLETAALRDQTDASEDACNARRSLEHYSQDGEHFYRIYVLSREAEASILTYEEANQKGVLDELLDDQLKKQYQSAKHVKPGSFFHEDGSSKDFSSVRDEVGKHVYVDLLKEIEKSAPEAFKKAKAEHGQVPSEFYTTYRFYGFLKQAQESIVADKDVDDFLSPTSFIQKQFKVIKNHSVAKRSQMPSWMDEHAFSMNIGDWSDVKLAADTSASFYQLKAFTGSNEKHVEEHLQEGHRLLSEDAKRFMLTQLLDEINIEDGIHLEKVEEGKS